jgi:MFS family permease
MAEPRPPLFTRRFFTMCGFTFTVFLSAFQLLPVAPFRILDLGGNTIAAGLFLGFLTYASALSAPFTGALADRVGKRRMLIGCSLVLAGFLASYAFVPGYRLLLVLVVAQGVFWSGLLAASSAYMTDFIPESRRAEGIGYWGMSTMLAVSVAPSVGFFFYGKGWPVLCAVTALLNLGMAGIAWSLPAETTTSARLVRGPLTLRGLVEWRVVAVSMSLFLVSFGYGGITSFAALFAERSGVTPKGLFFTVFACAVLVTRVFAGRLADEIGHRRFVVPCFVLTSVGMGLLAASHSRAGMAVAAGVFGLGFGSLYPAFAAHVVKHVAPARRGAAFGGILSAFDVGIGTGSMVLGGLIERHGFVAAYGTAAGLSALALPVFVVMERRYLAPRAPLPLAGEAAAG